MTYQEIKDRLSKCELALNRIKDGSYSSTSTVDLEKAKTQLEVLKESLTKKLALLKEADEEMGDDGFVATDDEGKAEDLAKKGVKVKLTKEQEGIEFSVDETKVIAKEIGKALIDALREVGDEIETVKGRNIEPNSFEIYVKYKNDFEDEFSFYISDDTLHLVDFSFDKEIGDVGVKPSGEAIVHVDVIKNNLVKHFKSLNEQGGNDQYLDKLFNIILKYTEDPDDAEKELDNYVSQGYNGFSTPLQANLSRDMEFISLTQQGHDEETYNKEISEEQNPRERYLTLLDMYKRAGRNDREDLKPKLEKAAEKLGIRLQLNEAPEGMYYIKVAIRDARKAIGVLDDKYPKDVIFSGSDTYYFTDEDTTFDVLQDFGAYDIEILDTNLDLFAENQEKDDYGRTGMEPRTFVDPEDMTVSARAEKLLNKEDVDIGHQDDEPDMLKQYAYDIATYAAKLYKQLDKYDKMDAEVDFPNWWQSKVILAKDYISKAQHYLEFEEKQPALDALALEEKTAYNYDNLKSGKVQPMHKLDKELLAKAKDKEEFHKLRKGYYKKYGRPTEEMNEYNVNPEAEKYVKRFISGVAQKYGYDEMDAVHLIYQVLANTGYLDMRLQEAQPTGFGTGQGRSKTISKGTEKNPELKATLKAQEPKKPGKYVMKNGIPHKMVNGKLTPLTKVVKEYTDKSFSGAELIDNVSKNSPDMFAKQVFADILPKGVASENDAIEALKAHDKSPIKARMGQYAPMFVHVQYHDLEHEGEKYQMHQTQYYNSNFKDKDPDFNPGVTRITLFKGDENLGTILVKTDEYVQDLRNLPGLGKRVSEVVKEQKATCCGKCGRVHVKGTKCKRPFLTGKDHCRNN